LKTITLSQLKKLTFEEIKDGECLEITANCEHLGFLIIGASGGMRDTVRNTAGIIDAAKGK
jgi:hypothetical protein